MSGRLQHSQTTLQVRVQESQGVGSKLHKAAAIPLSESRADRRHCIKQHAQHMCNSEAYIFPPWLSSGLFAGDSQSGGLTCHAAGYCGILRKDMTQRE